MAYAIRRHFSNSRLFYCDIMPAVEKSKSKRVRRERASRIVRAVVRVDADVKPRRAIIDARTRCGECGCRPDEIVVVDEDPHLIYCYACVEEWEDSFDAPVWCLGCKMWHPTIAMQPLVDGDDLGNEDRYCQHFCADCLRKSESTQEDADGFWRCDGCRRAPSAD